MTKLSELLVDLKDADFDISLTGFSSNELDQFFYGKKTNEDDEWTGMPDFEQNDDKPYKSIAVHFETESNYLDFAKKINQVLTDKTRFIFYPEKKATKNSKDIFLNETSMQ